MIFGLILLALVIAVAAVHYVQGLFSAMISACLAVFAALIAISYHEPIAERVFLSSMPNYAHAVALIGLFILAYLLPRFLIDKLVAGNVRMPLLVDKIGAGVFGIVAGILGAGIVSIAAQMLPFGPSLLGHSRFEVEDRAVKDVVVGTNYRRQDLAVYDVLKGNAIDPERASTAFPLAVDDMTLGLAYYTSNGGSLEGDHSLASVHPDYLTELFGQRIFGATENRVQTVAANEPGVKVGEIYTSRDLVMTTEDFESPAVRGENAAHTPQLPPLEGLTPIAVRASFGSGEQPFTMSSVNLILPEDGQHKLLYPIGAYQGHRLLLTRPDDYLFTSQAVDYVFLVPSAALAGEGNKKKLPDGTLLQIKRTARADLSGKPIADSVPDIGSVGFREKDKKQ